jgi:hypothetical protein
MRDALPNASESITSFVERAWSATTAAMCDPGVVGQRLAIHSITDRDQKCCAIDRVEILQEVVDGSFSGGGCLVFDSIDELNSGDHFGQQLRAV